MVLVLEIAAGVFLARLAWGLFAGWPRGPEITEADRRVGRELTRRD